MVLLRLCWRKPYNGRQNWSCFYSSSSFPNSLHWLQPAKPIPWSHRRGSAPVVEPLSSYITPQDIAFSLQVRVTIPIAFVIQWTKYELNRIFMPSLYKSSPYFITIKMKLAHNDSCVRDQRTQVLNFQASLSTSNYSLWAVSLQTCRRRQNKRFYYTVHEPNCRNRNFNHFAEFY